MRLPINFLLWVTALGLGGASGWQFWQAFQERKAFTGNASHKRALEQVERFVESGKSAAGEVATGPNYGASQNFWNSLRDANFIGKEPPKPVVPVATTPVETTPTIAPKTPLDDIVVLSLLVADGPDSRAVVRYRPTANVTPPPDAVPPAAAAEDTVGVPSTLPGGKAGARPVVALPTAGDGLGPVHHLSLGDRLWAPHDNIKLLRVDVSGDFAVFVRVVDGVEESKLEEERLFKAVLELPQDVLAKLAELGVAASPAEVRGAADPFEANDPSRSPNTPLSPSGWVAGVETREVDGRFHIGTNDREVFRTDPRVFSERLGTASYNSNGVRGVRVTRIPSELRNFGLQQNDIVIAVNGEPVSGKSEAFTLGRRLYDRGVRLFEIKMLRFGSEITRTYVAPDER
ncbi:MAG: hypothetical protein AB7I19_00690 [Planctomycetota bacterium]